MKTRIALLVLVALAVTAVLAPALAMASACPEDEADECCIPCGTRCLCCANLPRVVLASGTGDDHPGASGRVDSGRPTAPPTPSPRDILHVPRPATSPSL